MYTNTGSNYLNKNTYFQRVLKSLFKKLFSILLLTHPIQCLETVILTEHPSMWGDHYSIVSTGGKSPNICPLLVLLPFFPSHPKSEHASGQLLFTKLPSGCSDVHRYSSKCQNTDNLCYSLFCFLCQCPKPLSNSLCANNQSKIFFASVCDYLHIYACHPESKFVTNIQNALPDKKAE